MFVQYIFCVFTMYNTGWDKTRRALDCVFTIMAEISGRYWQILDRSGKKIILLSPPLYNESNAQNKFAFKCSSFHASNIVHQLSGFCALCFAIFADEVVLLIFVLQTFSWNHSPIYSLCSPLSSLETFWSICVTLCCKRYIARHRTYFVTFPSTPIPNQ